VAVVGAGLIGQSWAALFAAQGYDVVAWDPAPDWAAPFKKAVDRALPQARAVRRKTVTEGTIQIASSLNEAVSGAVWVQENAPESVALKLDLYEQIETATPTDAILASSTSSFTWSTLAAKLNRQSRFVTAHPFNPPHLMPLVEVYAPDAQTRERARCFFADIERHTVFLANEAVGHIANRLASALWREAVSIVEQGIADVAAVDAALVNGPGLRWSVVGSHMAYHLGGGSGGMEAYLQRLGPSQERRWETLGTPRLTPELSRNLIDGVLNEAAGRSIAELEDERDAALIRALSARAVTSP
jgi:3-hydroxyacyl-CoA dehydrogenase